MFFYFLSWKQGDFIRCNSLEGSVYSLDDETCCCRNKVSNIHQIHLSQPSLLQSEPLRFYTGTQSMAWEFNCSQLVSGFPGSSDGIESICSAETQVWSLGWEDPLEEEMPTHSSILDRKNPMDWGWIIVHRVTQSQTHPKWLSTHMQTYIR